MSKMLLFQTYASKLFISATVMQTYVAWRWTRTLIQHKHGDTYNL